MIAEIKDIRAFLHYSAHSRFWHLGLNRFFPRLIRGVISSLLFEALRKTNGVEMDMDIIHFRKWSCCLAISHAQHAIRQKNYKLTPSLGLKLVVLEEKHHFIMHLRTFHSSATN